MSIKAIALDAFGTTVIRDEKLLDPYVGLFHDCGAEISGAAKKILLTTKMDFRETVETFLPRHVRDMDALVEAAEKRLQADFAQAHRAPYLDQLVMQAKENGIDLVIVSNLGYRYGELVKTLIPDIPHTIFSYEAGFVKPQPEIFKKTAEEIGCAPREILMIGDRYENDILGSRNAGFLDALWLHPRYRDMSHHQREEHCGIESLGEVMLLVKRRGLVR